MSTQLQDISLLAQCNHEEADTRMPTKDALTQHIKRAIYQGAHSWGNIQVAAPNIPVLEDWFWVNPDSWKPMWTKFHENSCVAAAKRVAEADAEKQL